jgi:hypothetical protein
MSTSLWPRADSSCLAALRDVISCSACLAALTMSCIYLAVHRGTEAPGTRTAVVAADSEVKMPIRSSNWRFSRYGLHIEDLRRASGAPSFERDLRKKSKNADVVGERTTFVLSKVG